MNLSIKNDPISFIATIIGFKVVADTLLSELARRGVDDADLSQLLEQTIHRMKNEPIDGLSYETDAAFVETALSAIIDYFNGARANVASKD